MRLQDAKTLSLFSMFITVFVLYWSIACVVWSWRNPTANPMTGIRYIGHVLSYDKLDEFQVPSSR